MKCDKCFFCLHIGAGVYDDYPMKYCKYRKEYKMPFVVEYEKGKPKTRQLDFSDIKDCKIWHEIGCNIHPNTVKKAKNNLMKRIVAELKEDKNERTGQGNEDA